MYRYNFNSVCEGLFWVYYHISLWFWQAARWLWDCMFWRCHIYSWLLRAVVTFRCQPVALRRRVLSVTTFRKNLLPPSSEWKCKQREEEASDTWLFGFLLRSLYVVLFNSLPVFLSLGPFKAYNFPVIYTVLIGSFLVLPFLPSLSLPVCAVYSSALKMEVADSFETLTCICLITRHHFAETDICNFQPKERQMSIPSISSSQN